MKAALPYLCAALIGAGCVAAVHNAHAQPFSTPVGCDNCIGYWYYVDHGDTTDYNCESSTYSGHDGSDYSLRGGNSRIDDGNEVVAAASGIVRTASDGNYDRCTQCGGDGCGVDTPGGGFSNYVVIDHGDYDTTYGHMRNGSITVQVGDSVECGTVIGHIASAGCSTGAHLHFQPRLRGGSYLDALDPYEGPCSPTEASLWAEQGPHRGLPGHTCDDEPPVPSCPADTYEIWTCTADGSGRRRCIDGVDSTEPCPFGCSGMATGMDDVCALPPDDDADGVRADTDCDDTLADVHPGALESCGDGIDQDCSGADEACADSTNSGTISTTAGPLNTSASSMSSAAGGTTGSGSTGSGTGAGGSSFAAGATSMGQVSTLTTSSEATTMTTTRGPGSAEAPPIFASQPVESGCACRLGSSSSGTPRGLALVALTSFAFSLRRRPTRAGELNRPQASSRITPLGLG